MARSSDISSLVTKAGFAAAIAALYRHRRGADQVRAPGHRHRKLPPNDAAPVDVPRNMKRDQPWIRRSHSDSQKRRFRR